jgi:hypothetical protein
MLYRYSTVGAAATGILSEALRPMSGVGLKESEMKCTSGNQYLRIGR